MTDTFPAGNYLSVQDIIDLLNGLYEQFAHLKYQEIESPPKFEYNSYSNTVRVRLGILKNVTDKSRFLYPTLSQYMANFLCLSDRNDKQYPFGETFDLVVKTRKKDPEAIAISYHSQYHQQVDQLAVQVASVKDTVTKLWDDKNKTKSKNKQETQNKDRSFDFQQNLAKKKETRVIVEESPRPPSIMVTETASLVEASKTNVEQNKSHLISDPTPIIENKDMPININNPPNFTMSQESRIIVEKPKETIIHEKSPGMQSDQQANESEQVAYIYAFKQVSLHGYINNLNIYCNLVKPIAIGDIEAPLLRSVAVSPRDRFGEFVQYEPHMREYVPLLYHEFENIEIDIKDDSDTTIDFKFGKVYLSLHFRKINSTS